MPERKRSDIDRFKNEPPSAHRTAECADPIDVCPYCGRRCAVAVSRSMPRIVRDAYEAAKCDFMCTCDKGAAAEYRRFGASYADVIADRIHRGGDPAPPDAGRGLPPAA